MRRLAVKAPDLDIFRQGFIVRGPDLWTITNDGRSFLERLERAQRELP